MISDVLFDAVEELRRYQREFPQSYDGLSLEINQVIIVMDALGQSWTRLLANWMPKSSNRECLHRVSIASIYVKLPQVVRWEKCCVY